MDIYCLPAYFKLSPQLRFLYWTFRCEKEVWGRESDLHSPYLFILVLEILATSISENKSNQGIIVDRREIKLELFADLTVFLRNEESLYEVLDANTNVGKYTGLSLNFDFKKIEIKKSVKILGVSFTYSRQLGQ